MAFTAPTPPGQSAKPRRMAASAWARRMWKNSSNWSAWVTPWLSAPNAMNSWPRFSELPPTAMQCKWPLPQQRVTRVTRNEEQHCTKAASTTASGAGEIRKTDRRTAPELDNCEVDAARGLAAHHSCYRDRGGSQRNGRHQSEPGLGHASGHVLAIRLRIAGLSADLHRKDQRTRGHELSTWKFPDPAIMLACAFQLPTHQGTNVPICPMCPLDCRLVPHCPLPSATGSTIALASPSR